MVEKGKEIVIRRWFIALVGLACLVAMVGPAVGEARVTDPPGQPRRLNAPLTAPAGVSTFDISPDGATVLFRIGGMPDHEWWVTHITSGEPRPLAAGVACPCSFLAGGGLLAVRIPSSGEFAIVDTNSMEEVVRESGLVLASTADGRHLLYDDEGWIRSLDVIGPAPAVALAPSNENTLVAADGPVVLLRKTLTEEVGGAVHWLGDEVWAVDIDGGGLGKVVGGPGHALREARVTPDGNTIVVLYRKDDSLHVAGFAVSTRAELSDVSVGNLGGSRMQISQDSRWVVIDGLSSLVSVSVAGGTAREVWTGERFGVGHDDWVISPDSTAVVVRGRPGPANPIYEDATYFLYRASLDGSSIEQLTFNRDEEEDRSHRVITITPDSRWVVFEDSDWYNLVISRVPLAGGERLDLVEQEFDVAYFGDVQTSSDGERLAFISGEENPRFIMSLPTQGGTVVNLIPATAGSVVGKVAITPDSQRVVFVARYTPSARELWVVDIGHRCAGRFATLVGSSGADEISGTEHTDVIVGLGGDDVIRGRQSRDFICGGPGDDLLIGNGGRDVLRGQAGDDVLRGGFGPDRLIGGNGADRFYGGPGLDTCRVDTLDLAIESCEATG